MTLRLRLLHQAHPSHQKENHEKNWLPETSTKMVNKNKIAKELLSIISRYPYHRYVQCISPRDAVSDADFAEKAISSEYWIDKRKSYHRNLINSDYLFELFGIFSSEDGWSVRKEMVTRVKMEKDLYTSVGRIVLNMRGCTIDDWLEELEDPDNPPDELMLFLLKSYI